MKKIDFNNDWIVTRMDKTTDSVGSDQVTLPHDAMIYTYRSAENKGGGACGWFESGDYTYTKKFRIDHENNGKSVIVEFEGIYNRGYVYVNNCFAGSVHYGYTRLILDITQFVHYDAENEIRVKVINSDAPNSRWYTGSGLYRPVNIYFGGDIRIGVDDVRITTPIAEEDLSAVHAEVAFSYDGRVRKNIVLKYQITDMNGKVIAEDHHPVTLLKRERYQISHNIFIKNVSLWSPDEPNLYHFFVRILENSEVLDESESVFGIRKLELDPVNGLRINGKKTLLRGGCIHHDNGPLGAAAFAYAEERKIRLLKEAGFNAVRIAHNTASKAMLDACDHIGMLVMDESYDVWNHSMSNYDYALAFADHWQKDVEDFVAKDFNHPSVIMYSIGNEIPEIGQADGEDINRTIAAKIRELDPTRYVTNSINGLIILMQNGDINFDETIKELNAGEVNDVMTELMGQMNEICINPLVEEKLAPICADLDLSGYNYMRGVYDIYHEKYPNRIFYGSETLPPDIDLNWNKVKSVPGCIGDFTWTSWDYLGESGVGVVTYDTAAAFMKPFPVYLAYVGDIDLTGYRRPMSYYREIVFGLLKTPYIAVRYPEHYGKKSSHTPWVSDDSLSSWTWPGFEGKPCIVEVYSDAEEVELMVNDRSVGKLPAGEKNRYKAVFETEYENGKIEAVAYRNGIAAETFEIRTADQETVRIKIQADRTEIGVNDISYVSIDLIDDAGEIHTDIVKKIKVAVDGAGILQAVGSADPWSTENFFDDTRATFNGHAIAVVKSTKENGDIKVTVEAEGVLPAECTIAVRA